MTADKYPHVFSPVKIGPVEVKNRFYFSPHGNEYYAGGGPTDNFAYYYGERAAGGCGLLIHALSVVPKREGLGITPYLEETLPSFQAVAEHIHSYGAKIFGQLHYSRTRNGWRYEPGSTLMPLLAPSNIQVHDDFMVTTEMTVPMIKGLVDAYRRSSKNLARAGYDGIEIHCSHAMLAEAFLSPYFNRRTDEYGGSLENRMRFLVDCLHAAREGGGVGMAVGMRYNVDERIQGGLTQDDTREILRRLVDLKLLDFIDMDIAIEPDQYPFGMPTYLFPKRFYEPYVNAVRDAAGPTPVLSVLGRITSIAEAEEALASGAVDLVGTARGLMAEPFLVQHAFEGREEESRSCLHWNICWHRNRGMWGCALNPASGRERHWGVATFTPATKRSRLVVAGAGPGGLEAARVAALRGHEVVVLERGERIGGQLNLWAALPGREVIGTAPAWYGRQLAKLGVEVRLSAEATAASVLAEKPDAVIVATGGHYLRTGAGGYLNWPVPGWDQPFVYAPEEVIEHRLRFRGRVLILDEEGLNTGAGIAEMLARDGAKVTLVSRHHQPVLNMMGTEEYAVVLPRLKQLGVQFRTMTHFRRIGDHEVTLFDIYSNEEEVIHDVAAVVMATCRMPNGNLAGELAAKVEQVFAVGDALAPRSVPEAIHEGHRFARMIGEENAPRDFAEAFLAPIDYDRFQHPASVLLKQAAKTLA